MKGGHTRTQPLSLIVMRVLRRPPPLLLPLLLLLPALLRGVSSVTNAPLHRVRLRDVHLGDGDALALRLDYLGSAHSANATYLKAVQCSWVLASRADEDTPFAALPVPTVEQLVRGVLASGASPAMKGSFTAFDKSMAATGSSSDYGDVIFAVCSGPAVDGSTPDAPTIQRLPLPRRCRYKLNAVITPARWAYASNLSEPLSDHASASFSRFHLAAPYVADAAYKVDSDTSSLASQVYLSGGTTDDSNDWMDWSGNFKASDYWINPFASGKSWRMYHSTAADAIANAAADAAKQDASMTPMQVARVAETSIGDTTGPTLKETTRRRFGMAAVRMKTSTAVDAKHAPTVFHVGGMDEDRGVLAQTSVLQLTTDGTTAAWIMLPKAWDLARARHSHAVVSWTNHSGDGRQCVFAIGGDTADGISLRDVEMLQLPDVSPFVNRAEATDFVPADPVYGGWKPVPARLRVFRSKASAAVGPNGMLYVVGGELALLGEVERCDLTKGCQVFEDVARLRKPRYAGAAVWSHEMDELLYIGGFRVGRFCDYEEECTDHAPTFDGLVAGPSADVESYHADTDSWNFRTSMQVARYGLTAVEIAVPNPNYIADAAAASGAKKETRTWKQQQPLRHEILAMGGVGGLIWKEQSPMSPRRLNTVEMFSCWMWSAGERRWRLSVGMSVVVGLAGLLLAVG